MVERIFSGLDISTSGMTAQRIRMNAIANNIANAEVTRGPGGGPYRRQIVTFREAPPGALVFPDVRRLGEAIRAEARMDSSVVPGLLIATQQGVLVGGVEQSGSTSVRWEYDPGHPDADERGMVAYPDINVVIEMVSLLEATRLYEANATALEAAKTMYMKALEI